MLAVLLVAAGTTEAVRPEPVVQALSSLGWPVGRGAARFGAIAECIVGGAALMSSSRLVGGLVAASFLGFAGFIAGALQSPRLVSSCGCFGAEDSPPSRLHLVINLVLFAFAVAAAAGGAVPLRVFVAQHPMVSAPYLACIFLSACFVYLIVTELPRLATERRSGERSDA